MSCGTDNLAGALKELDQYIDSFPSTEGKLITVLHKAQEIIGYLPPEVQKHIALRLNIHASQVYGVVTFYSFFNANPKGKYKISVCMGTACFVRGAQKVLDEFRGRLEIDAGATTRDGLFSLDAIRCIGACGLAPVVSINEKIYGKVKPEDVQGIIDEYKKQEGLDA
jgi:NADH-quinone oxidoreductase subunit E/NADP-reducing hydrogenase subunit HndA